MRTLGVIMLVYSLVRLRPKCRHGTSIRVRSAGSSPASGLPKILTKPKKEKKTLNFEQGQPRNLSF